MGVGSIVKGAAAAARGVTNLAKATKLATAGKPNAVVEAAGGVARESGWSAKAGQVASKAKAAASVVLKPSAPVEKEAIRTWVLDVQHGKINEVPLRGLVAPTAPLPPAPVYPAVTEAQLGKTVDAAATRRLAELSKGTRKAAALATPEDGTAIAKAFHMASLGADQTGVEYPLAMARIGKAEGYRVVLRVEEVEAADLTKRLAAEKLDNVTLVKVKKSTELDFWSEDQGELHLDGSVSVPRRLTADGFTAEETTRVLREDRLRRLHPEVKAKTSTPEAMEKLAEKYPDIAFSGVGAVGERGGQRAIAAIAKGSELRMSSGYLEGGNSLVGVRANGEGYAIVGKDSLAISRAALSKDLGRAVSADEARAFVAADYGVSPKNLIAVEQPADFHIDMHMMLLPNGNVVVNDSKAAASLTKTWLEADLAASKPVAPGKTASAAAKAKYQDDLELWKIYKDRAPTDVAAIMAEANQRAALEARMVEDLRAGGVTVHRVPGVFRAVSERLTAMNFLNGEHATNAAGERFSIVLGGDTRAEQQFLQKLAALPSAPKRVHFLDRALTPTTLGASGGISCRSKLEALGLAAH